MNIAEFFVKLGVKDTGNAQKEVEGVKDELKGAAAAGDQAVKSTKKYSKAVGDSTKTTKASNKENKKARTGTKKLGKQLDDTGKKGRKARDQVNGVQKGLKDTAAASFEAKAGILAAAYALQRLVSASNQRGTELTNFATVLDTSAKTLQQYQYAGQQVGVTNDEMAATFKNLSSAAAKITLGQGAPGGLFEVAANAGVRLGPADIKRMADNPEEMIQLLQKFFQSKRAQTDKAWANEMGRTFGLSDNVIAAMRKNAFRPEAIAKAPAFSDKEAANLAKLDAQWKNLGTKWEMFFGKMNLQHGGELIKDLDMISTKVMTLMESFSKLAEKLKIFETIGKAFEGWSMIFDGINSGVTSLTEAAEDPKKAVTMRDSINQSIDDFALLAWQKIAPFLGEVEESLTPEGRKKQADYLKSKKAAAYIPELDGGPDVDGIAPRTWPNALGGKEGVTGASRAAAASGASNKIKPSGIRKENYLPSNFSPSMAPFVLFNAKQMAAPPMPAAAGQPTSKTSNVEFNQTLNFQGQPDPQKTADLTKQAVKGAYFSSPALSQGN